MNTRVTIGLCVKNAAKNVKTALNSISIQDYPHQFLKIVIVVDGSSDNTLSLASEFAQKTDIPTIVTFNDDKGLGAARQVVVDNAEGDYIVWVDDDFVLMRDFIRNQVDFMEKNPKVGAASSTVIPTCETIISMLDTLICSLPQRWRCSTGGAIFASKLY
jgi:glycosyltransferase involved in cell wall biosynthesis